MDTIEPYQKALRAWKRAYWTAVIAAAGGNVTKASRLAGTNRTDVYKQLKSHDVVWERNPRCGPGNWGDLSNEEPI